ncbi:MAG: TRAP transporter substrate-binding protein [Deltaproteobacteria bacterium]|nr:TRAP transporter substrate-binding protein [Deltaproteobacteria bacterium]MBW2077370.1 TRAP transporter substrate-binding protein [Deltaproteobacteria bacterium]MBW2310560.1 TRAP transporter substrate-binding protein [Deltaproteobacteria bacterium]
MRKKVFLVSVITLLVLGLLVAVSNNPAAQAKEKMHIKFSTWHPPMSREVKTVWTPMLEELKKRSNGRIDYTMYAGGALGKGPEHYDIVKKGLSDMGYFTATWTPGRFPLSDVLSLAVWVDGKDVGTDIGNVMYKRILHREFEGVKMIELNGCIKASLWTTKPVRTLEDCKGLRIRTPGGHQTSYIKALGAEPVFMPLGDVYLSMETGTIDGLVTCPPLVLAFKLYEVAKHGTIATFGCVTEGVIMNQKSWNKTPGDLKPIIEEVCSNPFRTTGGLTVDVYKTMMKEIAENGVELYYLSEEEENRWYAGFQDETRKWVKDLEAKGLPAKKTVKMYNEECEKRGIRCVACPPEWK